MIVPAGTVAVTYVSEFTVKVAALLPNATFVVCVKSVPVIVTEVPTGPLGGVNPVTVGSTLNALPGSGHSQKDSFR